MTAAANATWASTLARALTEDGAVTDVVVSPGSRSTPLVVAFAASDATAHVVLDERAAGFFALGLARTSGRPVALVCTSGSAAAHYLPAIIEACASEVPLIVLSADRPAELQGVGAGQTIDQVRLFGTHVRASFELTAPVAGSSPRWLETVAAKALDACVTAPRGPVHLNCPFRKPLWAPGTDAVHAGRGPIRIARGAPGPAPEELRAASQLLSGKRGAILVGPSWPPVNVGGVHELAQALDWPVLAEPASQLRSGNVVAGLDSLVRDPDVAAALRPDVFLRIGRAPTSTAVTRWMAGVPSLAIDPAGTVHDPNHDAAMVLAVPAELACRGLAKRVTDGVGPAWLARWQAADDAAWAATQGVLDEPGPLWEGQIARAVGDALPAGAQLHLASSMPIRDMDGFCRTLAAGVRVLHSRGANGIDGTIATVVGEAAGSGEHVVAVLGDLALRHDASSLALANGSAVPTTFVVVDNAGGGIFEFLPISGHPATFERFFLTPQNTPVPQLAQGYGVECVSVEDRVGLVEALGALSGADRGARLIHVVVDRDWNVARHETTWERVAIAARRALGLGGRA